MEDIRSEDPAEWFGHTTVHPVGVIALVLLIVATLFVPRRWAFAPMVILGCFLSSAQRVVVVGFDFDFLRIMILAGFLRLLVRGELRRLAWNRIDTFLVCYALISATAYTVLHDDSDSLVNRLGWLFDALGFYFLFRLFFEGAASPRRVAQTFIVAAVPAAAFFAVEFATHKNLFSVFGGIPAETWIRDGRIRCQGPFTHPIMAGVYWASVLPVVVALWWSGGRWKTWSVVGAAAILVIVAATASSTSYMAAIFGTIALAAFAVRDSMRLMRWSALGLLIALHLVMKMPVWHLLARATVFDASTGWHRYFVIDQAIHHFGEWWLSGVVTTEPWNVTDITNEYVWTGVEGGVFALAALVAAITFSFRKIGIERRRLEDDRAACLLTWALGCSLFVHCTNFIAVTYFAQSRMVWFLLLALIASQAPAAGRIRKLRKLVAKTVRPPLPETKPADAVVLP